jgi:hypothetical protein
MRVRTSVVIGKPAATLWPLLCDSRMDPRMPCFFRLGIPKPVECRLPDGEGRAGARRECVSQRAVVHQRITAWEPARRLQFHMEDTNLHFRPCVSALREEFLLEPLDSERTRLTRTTDLTTTGVFPWAKAMIMAVGLKCVHRYVFRNWARPGERPLKHSSAAPPPLARAAWDGPAGQAEVCFRPPLRQPAAVPHHGSSQSSC